MYFIKSFSEVILTLNREERMSVFGETKLRSNGNRRIVF